MKKKYSAPEMELILMEAEDVITSSNETGWVDDSFNNQ